MIILGVDPGYDRLGIAVLKKPLPRARAKEILLHSECFQTSSQDKIYTRFQQIGEKINSVIATYKPDQIAIETLFITKNQKTAMRVAETRGIILYEASKHSLPIHEYGPMEIKTAVTGDGTSDKDRIIRMVHMLVDIPAKKAGEKIIDDEYDAIAVALTCSAHLR